MAILAIIVAITGIVSALLIAVGSAITIPSAVLTAFKFGLSFLVNGISFLYLLLPADFWHFCGTLLSIVVAAHAAYFAYSAGISLWRIYQGGGE